VARIHTRVCAELVEGLFTFSELDRNSGILFDCCLGYRGSMGSPDAERLLVENVSAKACGSLNRTTGATFLGLSISLDASSLCKSDNRVSQFFLRLSNNGEKNSNVTHSRSLTLKGDSKAEGLLLVANKADRSLSIIDPEAGRELAVVPVGGTTGHEVAASSDGRFAWVPIYGDSGVGMPGSDGKVLNVIDLDLRKVVAGVDLQKPSRPHCAVFGPNDGRLYVTAELTNSIEILDPAARSVVDYIPTGEPESHMMVISKNGKRAYTSNVGPGTVSAIDIPGKKVLAVIHVSRRAQRIAISRDDRWVFTSDQMTPSIAVIDTQTNTIEARIPLRNFSFGLTPTLDGRYLLAAQPTARSVAVVDLQNFKVIQRIDVPPEPQEILVRSDNQVAYVSCDVIKQVAVINLTTWKVEKLIDAGGEADGLAWSPMNQRH
jgi:DNA-binding beta-propeller fold protein YncE